MAERIVVPADLSTSGTTIGGIAQSIEDELSSLKSALAPLAVTWTGTAQNSWDSLMTMWDQAATNLMTTTGSLGSIGQVATTNWTNYSDCETANTNTWAH